MPGAVAPDGTVASLKSRTATVLLNVSRGAGLPTKELASVGSAVMAKEAGSVMVALELQMLKGVVTPNGVVIGSGGTKGGGLIEAEGPRKTMAMTSSFRPSATTSWLRSLAPHLRRRGWSGL